MSLKDWIASFPPKRRARPSPRDVKVEYDLALGSEERDVMQSSMGRRLAAVADEEEKEDDDDVCVWINLHVQVLVFSAYISPSQLLFAIPPNKTMSSLIRAAAWPERGLGHLPLVDGGKKTPSCMSTTMGAPKMSGGPPLTP
jgi:hypothetical protein